MPFSVAVAMATVKPEGLAPPPPSIFKKKQSSYLIIMLSFKLI